MLELRAHRTVLPPERFKHFVGRHFMKKVISILLTLCILGAAGYFGWQAYQKYIAKPADSGSAALVTPYTIARGNLSKTVTGTGTLSISQTENVTLDYGVTVTEALAEEGDTVTAGQALLSIDTAALQTSIDTLQEELDSTVSQLATLSDSYSTDTYVKMPMDGRVKEVYIEKGHYLQDVMAEKGCIALLSLDELMTAEIAAPEGLSVNATVKVKAGSAYTDGNVADIADGVATITFSDAYGSEGGEVTIFYKEEELGTATCHIHMPYYLTASEEGYIQAVYLEVDAKKWQNNRVCYLTNVPFSGTYEALLSTQQSQLDQLAEMKALLAAGVITAPEDGIVSSIVSPSAAEAEAHSTLASLYVGDQKEMVVSVDELDIINVQVGQNADIAMDALTDKTYSAVVSKVSQIGTPNGGVTVYNVTLTIDGDENLKFGMNGTATIRIEELNDVLLVPLTALNTSRGESYVWLQSDSASADEPGVRTTVETGLSDENYAQVLSGLNEGDVVLITREASSSGTDSQSGGFDFGGMSFDMGSMPQGGGDMPGGGGNGGGGNGGGPGGNR